MTYDPYEAFSVESFILDWICFKHQVTAEEFTYQANMKGGTGPSETAWLALAQLASDGLVHVMSSYIIITDKGAEQAKLIREEMKLLPS